MRLVFNTVLGLLVVAAVGGLVLDQRKAYGQRVDEQFVQDALTRMQEQMAYRRIVAAESNQHRKSEFPEVLRPKWFKANLPVNILVDSGQPWLDIAPAGDGHKHPPDPICTQPAQAGFWYNPSRGVVRARVSPQDSDERTLAVYNRVNQSDLSRIPHPKMERISKTRRPIAFKPTMGTAALASQRKAKPKQARHLRDPFGRGASSNQQ